MKILAIDVGPVRYKHILQKLIHAEQTASSSTPSPQLGSGLG